MLLYAGHGALSLPEHAVKSREVSAKHMAMATATLFFVPIVICIVCSKLLLVSRNGAKVV